VASGNTLLVLGPLQNEPPAANFATFDTRNGHPTLDFDASTNESALFSAVLPRAYAGGGLTITLVWAATTATTGNVVWNTAIERVDTGTDTDADSFATANAATAATSATSGAPIYTAIAHTSGAQMDSAVAGELIRLKVTRDAANGSDTMAGDAEVVAIEIRET
jgi:hypothetical protein